MLSVPLTLPRGKGAWFSNWFWGEGNLPPTPKDDCEHSWADLVTFLGLVYIKICTLCGIMVETGGNGVSEIGGIEEWVADFIPMKDITLCYWPVIRSRRKTYHCVLPELVTFSNDEVGFDIETIANMVEAIDDGDKFMVEFWRISIGEVQIDITNLDSFKRRFLTGRIVADDSILKEE